MIGMRNNYTTLVCLFYAEIPGRVLPAVQKMLFKPGDNTVLPKTPLSKQSSIFSPTKTRSRWVNIIVSVIVLLR